MPTSARVRRARLLLDRSRAMLSATYSRSALGKSSPASRTVMRCQRQAHEQRVAELSGAACQAGVLLPPAAPGEEFARRQSSRAICPSCGRWLRAPPRHRSDRLWAYRGLLPIGVSTVSGAAMSRRFDGRPVRDQAPFFVGELGSGVRRRVGSPSFAHSASQREDSRTWSSALVACKKVLARSTGCRQADRLSRQAQLAVAALHHLRPLSSSR